MESKRYICAHTNTCRYVGTRRCIYGRPMPKDTLESLHGGIFNPRFTVYCDHPNVRIGVMLINVKRPCIEGDYHDIWTFF